MRICMIAGNRFHNDRRARAAHHALVRAGHDVRVIAIGNGSPRPPVDEVVSRRVRPANRLIRFVSTRLLPARAQEGLFGKRMTQACVRTGADLFLPLHRDMVQIAVAAARKVGAVVERSPTMDDAGEVDLIWLAPSRPELTSATRDSARSFAPGDDTGLYRPEDGRYRGERVVLCFRKTSANPGRYMEAALLRSGFDVRVETDRIDLATVDEATRFVLFVESPYPAIEVIGSTPVPVLFWVHHGEHHLYPNMRLAQRYGADAVLLAHSWHLSHWFPVPVHRLPFAVPTELFGPQKPLVDRRYDVAMVGAKLHGDAWQYRRRRRLVDEIESSLDPSRIRFVEGVSPEEMARIYEEARIVLNEGGVRHFPITMRVFEAVGSGAALLSDPAPGLDVLLEPGKEYAVLRSNVTTEVENLLTDLEGTQAMTDRASRHVEGAHTYDHRVDRLVSIAGVTSKQDPRPTTVESDLGRLIDRDVEVQRLVHDTSEDLAEELPDREVWPMAEREGRLKPGSMDAAITTYGDATETTALLAAARRYIYASDEVSNLDRYLSQSHPDAVVRRVGRFRRIDLLADAYRATTMGSPR